MLVHWNLRHHVCLRGQLALEILALDFIAALTWKKFFSSNMFYCHLQVQFGHAGACANQASETAVAKNQALRDAGAYVPKSFDELGDVIK